MSDIAGFDQRARKAEPAVAKALLEWLSSLASAASLPQLLAALTAGPGASVAGVLQAVRVPSLPELYQPAVDEARRALRLVLTRDEPDLLRLTFNVLDQRVATFSQQQVAKLVRDVDTSVQQAIRDTISAAYRYGMHPYEIAPQIQELVGLTSRQSVAVLNQTRALQAQGVHPQIVDRRAAEYTERLRKYRATTIARTETIRALAGGKMAGYEQAAADGYINGNTAQLVWVATDGACPECAALDGETADFADGFPDGLPPLHPDCRCTFDLIPG